MRIISRISTSISAALDRAVGSMENHDAIVEASIHQIRAKAGEVKARFKRVQSDAARMEEKIQGLDKQVELWAERAIAPHTNEITALECMQRRKNCQEQRAQLADSREQLRSVEARLRDNVERIEKRLRELQQQRSVMRSRQAAAEACKTRETLYQGCVIADIDETLERWDAQIMGAEITHEVTDPIDTLERQFVAEEDRASLAAELEAVREAAQHKQGAIEDSTSAQESKKEV